MNNEPNNNLIVQKGVFNMKENVVYKSSIYNEVYERGAMRVEETTQFDTLDEGHTYIMSTSNWTCGPSPTREGMYLFSFTIDGKTVHSNCSKRNFNEIPNSGIVLEFIFVLLSRTVAQIVIIRKED